MTRDLKDFPVTTHAQMLEYIEAGRTAISLAALGSIIRARPNTREQDDAELAELYGLLDLYDKHMARYTADENESDSGSNVQGRLL
jgi:hypothetical protein